MTAFLRLRLLASLCVLTVSACGLPTSPVPVSKVRVGTLRARQVGQMVTPTSTVTLSAEAPTGGEGVLRLVARVPEAHWGAKNREAATLRVWLDGIYNQDIVLYAGAHEHTYAVGLGALAAGKHQLRFDWFSPGSAAQVSAAEVVKAEVDVVPAEAPKYDVLRRAPILYGRENAHVSDTPILMMYEQRRTPTGRSLRYTPVFSNEDGGTATHALWARWGRTLDIDWCYQVELGVRDNPQRETYQGQWHLTRTFRGRYESAHPFLRVATDNNCFHDQGDSPFRFRPLPIFHWDPTQTSREEVLDLHPWSYALAASELARERKITPDPGGDGNREPATVSQVGDSRRFVIVEFNQVSKGRGVGVAIKLKGDARVYLSNRGSRGLQAARSGWCRVAVELPRVIQAQEIESINLLGLGRGEAEITAVRKILAFNEVCLPRVLPFQWAGKAVLRNDRDRVTVFESSSTALPPSPAVGL